jgi:hypothetical protein
VLNGHFSRDWKVVAEGDEPGSNLLQVAQSNPGDRRVSGSLKTDKGTNTFHQTWADGRRPQACVARSTGPPCRLTPMTRHEDPIGRVRRPAEPCAESGCQMIAAGSAFRAKAITVNPPSTVLRAFDFSNVRVGFSSILAAYRTNHADPSPILRLLTFPRPPRARGAFRCVGRQAPQLWQKRS